MSATLLPFSVALADPLGTADGELTRREGLLLRWESGGHTGLGEAAPLPGWTESFGACERVLSRARDRLAEGDVDGALSVCEDAPAARHAVDCAVRDRRARRAGVPLYRYLGRDREVQSVPANATVGDADPSATAAAVADAVDAGFDCVKVKAGARSLDEDAERLRAVRERVGPDVTLRVDANGAWTRSEADAAVDRLSALGVAQVEQPLPAGDLVGHAALRNRGVDVAVDESLAEHDAEAVLEAGAADVLVVKPMVVGGVERAAAVTRAAREAGVAPVLSTTLDAAVARAAATHVAATVPDVPPCGLATADRLVEDVAPDAAPVSDGRVSVPQVAGHGVSLGGERQ